jgi:hypothetical protein
MNYFVRARRVTRAPLDIASARRGGRSCCAAEIYLWNDDAEAAQGVHRYCSYFPNGSDARFGFEKTPKYSCSRNTPLNLLAVLPARRMRFVYTFRELGALSWSMYVHTYSYRTMSYVGYVAGHLAQARLMHACVRDTAGPSMAPAARNESLPALTCRLAPMDAASYHALAEATRNCPARHDRRTGRWGGNSSELTWVHHLMHWTSLVGADSVLAVPHLWIRERSGAVRRRLLEFTGIAALVSAEALDRFASAPPTTPNSVHVLPQVCARPCRVRAPRL